MQSFWARFRALPMLAIPLVILLLASACGGETITSATQAPVSEGNEAGAEDDGKAASSNDAPREGRSPTPSERPTGEGSSVGPLVTVTRVIDGDTIEVARRGRTMDIRFIGIDTPETVHPSQPVGCFGPEASSFTSKKLEGQRLRLEFDVERRDHYGRLLAYIWVDGKLFNKTLVRQGYAQVSTYPPNVKYVDEFVAAQRRARKSNAGLWGADCPAEGSQEQQGSSGGGGGGSNCDSAYPDVCIPSPPPDLDCGDISHGSFRVLAPDPHGFDGSDNDGIGCES
jgi:micrococcal nuclease